MDLSAKRFLVAGAGGIGAAVVMLALDRGASVLAVDVDRNQLGQLSDAARAAGVESRLVVEAVDVTRLADLRTAVANGEKMIGVPNAVVNTVGVTMPKPLLDTSIDDLMQLASINVGSMLTTAQAVVPLMTSGGCIVNLASSAASTITPGLGMYGATKAAVMFLTRALANELAPRDIRVNAVAPGIVDTPMPRLTMAHEADPEDALLRVVRETHLIPRMARPEEIAAGVLFLASDEASFATGTTLFLDGGNTSR
jgi:NAD(P)-dependent dehydrogenase (short-subunit alcohol dehydrogenase family)